MDLEHLTENAIIETVIVVKMSPIFTYSFTFVPLLRLHTHRGPQHCDISEVYGIEILTGQEGLEGFDECAHLGKCKKSTDNAMNNFSG